MYTRLSDRLIIPVIYAAVVAAAATSPCTQQQTINTRKPGYSYSYSDAAYARRSSVFSRVHLEIGYLGIYTS